jgi:hypothetical protein
MSSVTAERCRFDVILMPLRQRFAMIRYEPPLGNDMPLIKPTSEQKRVIDEVSRLPGTRQCWCLHGPAGTGKTTTMQLCAKLLDPNSTIFLAPTHKAASVLRENLGGARHKVKTVASFLGRTMRIKEGEKEFVPATPDRISQIIKQWQASGLRFVIIDESSMIAQEDADLIEDIAKRCGASCLFVGDPYQLPPIASERQGEDGDCQYHKNMCWQFTRNDKLLELTKVLRHGGPVLEYATDIRERFKEYHSFPIRTEADDSSSVVCLHSSGTWLESLFSHVAKHKLEARAVTFTNSRCVFVTKALRENLYGDKSARMWVPGEVIAFPNYTPLPMHIPGQEQDKLYSQTEAVVECAETLRVNEVFCEKFEYSTPSGQPRELCISMDRDMQLLRLRKKGLSRPFFVICPFLDDEEIKNQRRSLAGKLTKIKAYGVKIPDWVYAARNTYYDYFPTIYSANVMTVHKSQGSTFKHVFIDRDVNSCDSDFRNSLLYVAATRAGKSAHFNCG